MGVENGILVGSGFGESGGSPIPRVPRSTPRVLHCTGWIINISKTLLQ